MVVFDKAAGLSEPELLWPAPERFELPGDLVAFGYENEVVYPVRARLSQAPGDVLKLSADVDYLVCEVDCIPYRYTLTPGPAAGAAAEPDPETAAADHAWWDRLPAPVSSLAGVTTAGALVAGAAGRPWRCGSTASRPGAEPPGLFLETHEAFDTGKPAVRTTDGGVVFRVPLRPRTAGQALPQETGFAWTVTRLVQRRPAGEPGGAADGARGLRRRPAPSDPRERLVRSPIPAALLAVARRAPGPVALGRARPAARGVGREALGFAALAAVLGLLYALSRQVSFEGLAWIELTLLGDVPLRLAPPQGEPARAPSRPGPGPPGLRPRRPLAGRPQPAGDPRHLQSRRKSMRSNLMKSMMLLAGLTLAALPAFAAGAVGETAPAFSLKGSTARPTRWPTTRARWWSSSGSIRTARSPTATRARRR